MPIIVYGISHKTAPLSVREHLSFSSENIHQALVNSREIFQELKEVMILSTCQRTEWYLYAETSDIDLHQLLGRTAGASDVENYSYTLYGKEAIKHMMRVSNGLDSSLLGEPQILGQVKAAYGIAKNSGFLGKHLEQVMQFIFASAKKIRNQTSIGQGVISLPSTAITLGKCIFSALPNPHVLLIGGGSVIQGILNHLAGKKNLQIVIANRSHEKGLELAKKYRAKAIQFDHLAEEVSIADVVISATASASFILTKAQIEKALVNRAAKPLFMIDMAVPRDIDPEIVSLGSVFLYNIDDLHKIIQKNLDARTHAAFIAEQMIEVQIQVLEQKMQANGAAVFIHNFRQQLNDFRQELLKKAAYQLEQKCAKEVLIEVLQKLESWVYFSFGSSTKAQNHYFKNEAAAVAFHQLNLGKSPDQVLCEVTRNFVNKLLHAPTLHFKKMGNKIERVPGYSIARTTEKDCFVR